MTKGSIILLATLASFANEKILTEWIENILPPEVVKNMTYVEKFEYLQELKHEAQLRPLRGGE